jgi:hypothetical protein
MAVARFAVLHLFSVRTGLVPAECYYILYWKASNALYLGKAFKKATSFEPNAVGLRQANHRGEAILD